MMSSCESIRVVYTTGDLLPRKKTWVVFRVFCFVLVFFLVTKQLLEGNKSCQIIRVSVYCIGSVCCQILLELRSSVSWCSADFLLHPGHSMCCTQRLCFTFKSSLLAGSHQLRSSIQVLVTLWTVAWNLICKMPLQFSLATLLETTPWLICGLTGAHQLSPQTFGLHSVTHQTWSPLRKGQVWSSAGTQCFTGSQGRLYLAGQTGSSMGLFFYLHPLLVRVKGFSREETLEVVLPVYMG